MGRRSKKLKTQMNVSQIGPTGAEKRFSRHQVRRGNDLAQQQAATVKTGIGLRAEAFILSGNSSCQPTVGLPVLLRERLFTQQGKAYGLARSPGLPRGVFPKPGSVRLLPKVCPAETVSRYSIVTYTAGA